MAKDGDYEWNRSSSCFEGAFHMAKCKAQLSNARDCPRDAVPECSGYCRQHYQSFQRLRIDTVADGPRAQGSIGAEIIVGPIDLMLKQVSKYFATLWLLATSFLKWPERAPTLVDPLLFLAVNSFAYGLSLKCLFGQLYWGDWEMGTGASWQERWMVLWFSISKIVANQVIDTYSSDIRQGHCRLTVQTCSLA